MNSKLNAILERLNDGSLLPADVIASLDHDGILDLRDEDAVFESEWMRCFKEIERRWSEATIDGETLQLCQEIRKESFMQVSRASGQHEIASYVSDDFDIISRAMVLGFDDPFISRLWQDYQRGEILGSTSDE